MKTRLMANKDEYKSILDCASGIWKERPFFGFWKGKFISQIDMHLLQLITFLLKTNQKQTIEN